ncbi:hypothetical protein D9M72_559160 [compost metagenome]
MTEFGFRPAHPDREGLADDILVGNHAQQILGNARIIPVATVVRVVAVVAHHEVVPGWHGPRMVRHGAVATHLFTDHVLGDAEFFLVELGAAQRARLGADRLLGNRLTVDEQTLVGGVANRVARQANHTLDVVDVRIARVTEYHHIAALRITDFDDFLVDHR